MIIPVRCFSCGHVIGHLWERYSNGVEAGRPAEEMLNEVGLERYCCRRMFVSHVELIDDIAPFSVTKRQE
jgi:DNA-directed RNA polymerase subunit N